MFGSKLLPNLACRLILLFYDWESGSNQIVYIKRNELAAATDRFNSNSP